MMDRNEAESVIKDTIVYANEEIKKNKKKTRKILITILVVAIVIIALLGSSLISYVTFNVGNPFSATIGFFQIAVLDKDYVEISESPKVVLAQPNADILTDYMESRGFTEIEQMGAMHTYSNGDKTEMIHFSMNKYWSKWIWE